MKLKVDLFRNLLLKKIFDRAVKGTLFSLLQKYLLYVNELFSELYFVLNPKFTVILKTFFEGNCTLSVVRQDTLVGVYYCNYNKKMYTFILY